LSEKSGQLKMQAADVANVARKELETKTGKKAN